MISLRPMTQVEFDVYLPSLVEGYAQERAAAAHTPLEVERETSRSQIASLLKAGLATANQHVWRLAAEGGEPVGILWVDVSETEQRAFIYDFVIEPAFRGKGYGKQALEALETELRPKGVRRILLNVFGHNQVARHLYERSGYGMVAITMQKDI